MDANWINSNYDNCLKEGVDTEPIISVVVGIYLFFEKEWNKFFCLLNSTKQIELLALKAIGYLEINRLDLAEQVTNQMKAVDEDNCLTTLTLCWVRLHKAPSHGTIEGLITTLNELGEKNGYTTKTYNLLGITLMVKGEPEKAVKILENGLNELKLESTGANNIYPGNKDLASLVVNLIKSRAIVSGNWNDEINSDAG